MASTGGTQTAAWLRSPPDCSPPAACGHSDIAIALHTPPHRAVSLALVAQAIGAKKQDALTDASRRLSKKYLLSQKNLLSKKNKSPSKVEEVEVVSAASSSEDKL